jgi:hypothetical protein
MNGLAKLLKALFPKLNWETPESVIRSTLPPSVDLDQLILFVNSVPKLVAALAAKQAEIDAALQYLMAREAARESPPPQQQQQHENEDKVRDQVPVPSGSYNNQIEDSHARRTAARSDNGNNSAPRKLNAAAAAGNRR